MSEKEEVNIGRNERDIESWKERRKGRTDLVDWRSKDEVADEMP